MKDYSLERKVRDEMELLGFSLSAHPLDLFDLSGFVTADALHAHVGRKVRMAGVLIAGKMVSTKKPDSRPMKFLSFEDLTGDFDVTLFPRAYSRYAVLTLDHQPLAIWGRVENDMGALSLVADRLERLEAVAPRAGDRPKG